jgi:hypothetical protein
VKKIKVMPILSDLDGYDIYPVPAISKIPDWFKKVQPYYGEDNKPYPEHEPLNMTVKKCIPFLDALTYGYMLTTPADILVSKNSDGSHSLKWNAPFKLTSNHLLDQVEGVPFPENLAMDQVWKWENIYRIKTPRGYSILITHPLQRWDLPFYSLNGIVDSDKYSAQINVPFLFKKDFEGIIPAGTPIAQIIPFKRDDWSLEVKPWKYNLYKFIKTERSMQARSKTGYKKQFWQKKTFK